MPQTAITFESQGVTVSPAYECVGLIMKNLFRGNLCRENRFEGPKTQNAQKIGEI